MHRGIMFSDTPITVNTGFAIAAQKPKSASGRMLHHFRSAPEYSKVFSLLSAPTFWLMRIEAPIEIEKQNDIDVHIGVETLLRALMFNGSRRPRKMRSINI